MIAYGKNVMHLRLGPSSPQGGKLEKYLLPIKLQ